MGGRGKIVHVAENGVVVRFIFIRPYRQSSGNKSARENHEQGHVG